MSETPWFPPTTLAAPSRRLFCVPFAGGGIGVYSGWQAAMPPGTEVLPIQLPGRERRLRERPYASMRALVADLFPAMLPKLDVPFAIFGHSMGAAIAFELALAATQAGKAPAHLFLSARRAPGSPPTHPPLFALPEELLLRETERLYGPLPAVLREHPGLLATFLPTMRADMQLLDTWIPPEGTPLACPVTVLGGDADLAVPPPLLQPWRSITTGPFEHLVLPGNHFSYVREQPLARDLVAERLAALSAFG